MDAECLESIRRAKMKEMLEIKVIGKFFGVNQNRLVTLFMEHSHTSTELRVLACAT